MVNLARGMFVNVSSSDALVGGYPGRATDGSTAGTVYAATTLPVNLNANNYCTSTNTTRRDNNPWLRVDLGVAGARFDAVQFFGRTDCAVGSTEYSSIDCYTRNAGF